MASRYLPVRPRGWEGTLSVSGLEQPVEGRNTYRANCARIAVRIQALSDCSCGITVHDDGLD